MHNLDSPFYLTNLANMLYMYLANLLLDSLVLQYLANLALHSLVSQFYSTNLPVHSKVKLIQYSQ